MNKIIGCGIDKWSWEHSIDSDNLFDQYHLINLKKKKHKLDEAKNSFLSNSLYRLILWHWLESGVKGNIPF